MTLDPRKAAKKADPASLPDTVALLEYIAAADQPTREHGGFDDNTKLAARSALHWLAELKGAE